MDREYRLFDFQDIIAQVREKHQDDPETDRKNIEKVLEGIGPESKVEDLVLYKEYLFLFDVENSFQGFELAAADDEDIMATKDDLLLLCRLICASHSSRYDFSYDADTNAVDLLITVKHGDQSITKGIKELFSLQVIRLFEIYLKEQIELSAVREDNGAESDLLMEERALRVLLFKKKVMQLQEKKERLFKNRQESDEIQEDMDDLLSS